MLTKCYSMLCFCLSACLSVCMSLSVSVYRSVHPCLSVHPYLSVLVSLSVCQPPSKPPPLLPSTSYNGSLPLGDKGRRRSKFALVKRNVANGVKPVRHHVVKNPQQSEVSHDNAHTTHWKQRAVINTFYKKLSLRGRSKLSTFMKDYVQRALQAFFSRKSTLTM